MPFVPNVPGVPPLSSFIPNAIVPLLGDAIGLILGALNIQTWGIFLDGVPVLTYDNFVSFDYSQDWEISTYPVEDGSFTAYDKVQRPAEIRVSVSAGGSVANRQVMLLAIDAQMSTTLTYDIVTPETVYLNYNFIRREFDRAASNVGLVLVHLYFMEIIETATSIFQNTFSPANAGQVGLGTTSAAQIGPSSSSSISLSGWQ